MTKVSLLQASNGRLCGYEISGHSGYAPRGEDIVCAALSFFGTTCCNALESVAGVKPQTSVDEEKGHLKVVVPESQLSNNTDVIFALFKQGISDLSDSYPKYVSIL